MTVLSTSASTETIRAVRQHAYGGPEVLQPGVVAAPTADELAADEVLVQVHAAGVDRGTWHLMTGEPRLMRLMGFGLRRPKQQVAGLDVAGTVLAVGTEVEAFAVGDEVLGFAQGAFAEVAVAKVSKLAHRPPGLSVEQAAVLSVSGVTALQAVREVARVQPGDRVLVLGGSGGVGHLVVQLAAADGAHVTATCRHDKEDFVRGLGAEQALAHDRVDPLDGMQRYDVIIDGGGNPSLPRLRRCLERDGRLAIVGAETGGVWTGGFGRSLRAAALSPLVSQRLAMVMSRERGSDVAELASLVADGVLAPHLDRTFPLEQVQAAMARLLSGDVQGKVLLTVG